jgi:hypothetical protein
MGSHTSVVLLFLDGVGLGKKDSRHNPFFAVDLPVLKKLLGGAMPHNRDAFRSLPRASLIPLNATLGVPGLPQSGTGQTTLLTGINASKIIGKHFGPYPYSALRPVLDEKNIFTRIQKAGKKALYVNAFPQKYFDYIKARPARISAISSAWLAAGNRLNDSEALKHGNALSADMTAERWNKLGFPEVPVLTPFAAGERLAGFAEKFHFTLFEFYETDHAGHSRSMEEAGTVLRKLDEFLGGIFAAMDFSATLLIVTSDHGNLESLETKGHTRNRVPLIAVGKGHHEFVKGVSSLKDVTPAVIRLLAV